MTDLKVFGRLTAARAHACAVPSTPTGPVVIDLRRVTWLEPAGLVALAASAALVSKYRYPVDVMSPQMNDTANYLARMRLGPILDSLGVRHDMPRVREKSLATRLVELTMFSSDEECNAAAERVRTATVERCGEEVASTLYEALIEAVQNVLHHSRADRGFLAAQTFPKLGVLSFAVADAGIGLQESLSARGAEDDAGAINLALSGVSRFDDGARGRGVPSMRELTERAGGGLEIVSGHARFSDGEVRDVSDRYLGTLIQGTLAAGPPPRKI